MSNNKNAHYPNMVYMVKEEKQERPPYEISPLVVQTPCTLMHPSFLHKATFTSRKSLYNSPKPPNLSPSLILVQPISLSLSLGWFLRGLDAEALWHSVHLHQTWLVSKNELYNPWRWPAFQTSSVKFLLKNPYEAKPLARISYE